MKVLIVGSGAREHAMAWAAAKSSLVSKVFVAPGNGGTALMGGKVSNVAVKATDIDGLVSRVRSEGVELTVVGPEQPLEAGIVDRFRQEGLKVVGPTQAAARLESSKAFSKAFMQRNGIPTASYRLVTDAEEARVYLSELPASEWPQVIKASGLCAGKGVVVAPDLATGLQTVTEMFEERIFGDAADEVVIEGFLKGEEASVFALTDGSAYRLFLPAQDHKRIGEGDTGKNTGGMGAYAPAPLVTPEVLAKVEERVVRPTLEGMRREGCPFTGFLYVGLMIDRGEPSVVEFNARLGDPETQVVLPLLKSDFVAALLASVDGGLDAVAFDMEPMSAATVVIASEGYPDAYPSGREITIDPALEGREQCRLFHAGTSLADGRLLTAGGRVVSVTALGQTLSQSIDEAYRGVSMVSFEGAQFRRDIGARALNPASDR